MYVTYGMSRRSVSALAYCHRCGHFVIFTDTSLALKCRLYQNLQHQAIYLPIITKSTTSQIVNDRHVRHRCYIINASCFCFS